MFNLSTFSGHETHKDGANITSTATGGPSAFSASGNIFTDLANNPTILILLVLLGVALLVILLSLVCFVVTRLGREASSKKNMRREDSEENTVYQNTSGRPIVRTCESMRTHMFRKLPPIPLDTAGAEENAYLLPISPLWHRCDNEIKNLPPAPPVFPEHLANLQLDGEGSYIRVVSEEEAQLSPPNSPCQISPDDDCPEMCEESGYVQPRQIYETPVEKRSSEIECSRKLEKVKDSESQKPKRVGPDTRVQRVLKNVQDTSTCKPHTDEDASEMKSEPSNDEKAKRFRSTLQILLSPPTRPRHIPVPTSKTTVVLCIRSEFER